MGQLRYDTEFAIVHLPVSKDQPVDWLSIADDEYANKKICSRILKYRAHPNQQFQAEEFKQTAMKSMAASGQIADYRKRASQRVQSQQAQSRQGSRQQSRHHDSQQSGRSKAASRPGGARADAVRQSRESTLSHGSNPLSEEDEVLSGQASHRLTEKEKADILKEQQRQIVVQNKLTAERTQQRQEKIIQLLEARDEKKNTPDFVDKYFVSFSGNQFLARNPPEPPSDEVMTRMKQRIERSGKERSGDNAAQAFDNENAAGAGN